MKFVALDLETTGLDPENDAIIEIAAIKFEDGKIIDEFQTLINPEVQIPVMATHITGITNEMVSGSPTFEEVSEKLKEFLGDYPILGQNIKFDLSFLRSHGMEVENAELDTFVLARAIIPKAESYSLEVLAEKLKIDHTDAHRAYDDALASVHLMDKLRLMMLSESDTVLEKIEKFLSNQKWSWKEFVLESIAEKEAWKEEIENLNLPKEKDPSHHEEGETLTIPLDGKKLTEGFIDPEKYDFSEKTFVALPGFKAYYFPEKSFKLKHHYLLPERFAELLEKNKKWNEEEIIAIIKLIIWFAHTETFETSELTLYNKEFGIINRINLEEHETHEIYETKLRELEKLNKIYISHLNLLKLATLDLDLGIDIKNLVVLDGMEFEKSLMRNTTVNIGIGDTEGEGEMLFGLLGIIFEKFKPENLSFPEIEIDDEILAAEEWKRCIPTAEKVIENFEPHLPPKLRLLKEVISSPEKFHLKLLQANEGDVLLRITPKDILKVLHEKIWDKFENVIINDDIIDTPGTPENSAFLRTALQLTDFTIKKTALTTPNFKTFPDLPQTKEKSFPREASKRIANIIKNSKTTLIVFPSNGPISNFIDKINLELESLGIKEEKNTLGQGVSGSNGKILNKLTSDKDNVLLVNFDFALELVEIFKDRGLHNITLIFTRLPFMHPENSYTKYVESFYSSSYDAYKTYSLPKAKCRILKLISRYEHEFEDVTSYVLDGKFSY